MEVVGTTSAVVELAAAAWKAYNICQEYYKEVKNAKRTIQNLRVEVGSLALVLSSISDLYKDGDSTTVSHVGFLMKRGGPVQQCRDLLIEILAKLDLANESEDMKKFGKRALEWPFRAKEVEKLLSAVREHKGTFNLALAADTV